MSFRSCHPQNYLIKEKVDFMRTVSVLFAASLALLGCDNKESASTTTASPQASSELQRTTIYLPDGTGLAVASQSVRASEKDGMKIYRTTLKGDLSVIEGGVHSVMSKAGYSRKVVTEKDGEMKVHYYKKDGAVIGSSYVRSGNDAGGVLLSIYWQEA